MEYRVNIDEANETKSGFSKIIDGTDDRLLNRVGAFASLFKIDVRKYSDPVLVLKTEEPGTKQILAIKHDRVKSVCYDMINHLINDCVVMGATPLAVQDLIVCGKLEKTRLRVLLPQFQKYAAGMNASSPGVKQRNSRIFFLLRHTFLDQALSVSSTFKMSSMAPELNKATR